MAALSRLKPCNLHVTHSWGGGVDRWVRDFCAHDRRAENLVLENIGTPTCYGVGVRLVAGRTGRELGRWLFRHPISETRVRHAEYREVLARVVGDHDVSHIYLSCLVGHSLDIFDLGVPVTKIHHDYYPCCPNIYMFWGEPCSGGCGEQELALCLRDNPVNFANDKSSAAYWLELRGAYVEALARPHVRQVCPSVEVVVQLARLDPALAALAYAVIPHGTSLAKRDSFGGAEEGRRLRVVVLGMQHIVKGLEILKAAFSQARLIVDLSILGGGPHGRVFASRFGVSYLEGYRHGDLDGLLAAGGFDLALFASAFAETFCYTLSEVRAHAIPPAVRPVGSFLDRVHDGEDGFMMGPTADDLVAFLLRADAQRDRVREVSRRLRALPVRSVGEMVDDYYRLRGDYPGLVERRLAAAAGDDGRPGTPEPLRRPHVVLTRGLAR